MVLEVREGLAELRTSFRHLQTDVDVLRHDVRRLDARLLQPILGQLATLSAALGALAAALAGC